MARAVRSNTTAVRLLGIALMIPGLLHVPLPQADFHVIRHHHGVKQVCPRHDHLLRWHPQAGQGEDVAVLHWHWFLPPNIDLDAPGGVSATPALHAHVSDPLDLEWEAGPVLLTEEVRTAGTSADDASGPFSWLPGLWAFLPPDPPRPAGSARMLERDDRGPSAPFSSLVRRNC